VDIFSSLTSVSQAEESRHSVCRTTDLDAVPPFGDIGHFVHLLGHVTYFHDNRCYGNQSKCVFGKNDPKFI